MFSKRDGIASKTELPDQNVDKSGKIVDNRPKMCKSAFKNFLPVLPEAYVVQVLPVRRGSFGGCRSSCKTAQKLSTIPVDKFSTLST